ncbi:Sulfotransferase domain-containing protein [Gammaproteobacteria bacterium]
MILTRFDPQIHRPNPVTDDTPESHLFYVLSWGYAADHGFSWWVKALNAHPELLVYLANEGSRPKYFPEERSRAHRPDAVKFTRFLADVGMTYTAIGDCYSYRCPMMEPVRQTFGGAVRMVQLTRNPYVFLHFHIAWRSRNMRMLPGESGPLDHEWNAVDHERMARLGLKPYTKEDMEVWSAYQGMIRLNDILADTKTLIPHLPLEKIMQDREWFQALVGYLTHGRIHYDDALLDRVYDWVATPFRGEKPLPVDPERDAQDWPDWKQEAFTKLVRPETLQMFRELGYALSQLPA